MRLSKHFKEKWIDLMGYEPTKETVEEVLKGSICVQKFKAIKCKGNIFVVPAIFWNFKLNLMLKVDELSNTIITVYAERRAK